MPRRAGRVVAEGETWINVRLPEEDKAALEEWARKTRRTMSYMARRLIQEAIEQGRAQRGEQL